MLLHRDDPVLAFLREQGEPVYVLNVNPTAENIARDIWERLEPHFTVGRGRLRAVRVYETPDFCVDYCGEQPCSA